MANGNFSNLRGGGLNASSVPLWFSMFLEFPIIGVYLVIILSIIMKYSDLKLSHMWCRSSVEYIGSTLNWAPVDLWDEFSWPSYASHWFHTSILYWSTTLCISYQHYGSQLFIHPDWINVMLAAVIILGATVLDSDLCFSIPKYIIHIVQIYY